MVQVEHDGVHHLTDGPVKQLNVGHFAVALVLQHDGQTNFTLQYEKNEKPVRKVSERSHQFKH